MTKAYLTLIALFCAIGIFAQTSLEIISERTANSKTFLKSNGAKEQVISTAPVHYKVNENWETIDNTLVSTSTSFENQTNVLKSSFPKTYNGSIELSSEGFQLNTKAKKQLVIFDEINGLVEIQGSPNDVQGIASANVLAYPNVYAGITDRYVVENALVKNELILDTYPSFLSSENGNYFGYVEDIELPNNWSIEPVGIATSNLINSTIAIKNENNETVSTIPAPVFYELGNFSDDGKTSVNGGFVIDKVGNTWKLATVIPTDWLNISGRSFPVVMDPTVQLVGNTGGWQSQNNYVNNPGYVFIGVCCGNLEHRAWIKWDVSSIPDNACVTLVELEVYVNGVGATTAELVHAYDMMATTSVGTFGPYGGIIPAVYTDMGNGYYTSFTLTGTGYYGWYDLGANACTDVMQMMNSYDWYQVSLIFDNEPSTNWKRLTATLCDLRITYDTPPCTVLPIGLVDFEASCEGEQHLLTWSTVSEQDNDYFTIWESINGIEFTEVAKVEGKGNSTELSNYRWIADNTNGVGKVYRLSQTDFDGTTTTYEARFTGNCGSKNASIYTDHNDVVHVLGENMMEVNFVNQQGLVVANEKGNSVKEFSVNSSSWRPGSYIATIQYKNGEAEQVSFIIAQ